MRNRAELAVDAFTPERPVEAPPVLLVHGFGSSGRADWSETGMVAALTGAGRSVLVPDLRGHGRSSAPAAAEEATAGALAEDLLAVLRSAGAETVDVVAYSLGARVVWELAALWPGSVGRAVLGGLSPGEPFTAVDVPALHAAVADGAEPGDPFTAAVAGMVRSHGDAAPGLALCVEGLRSTPFEPTAWGGGTAPVLVVGEDDMLVRGTEDLAGVLAAAELVRVAGDHQQVLRGAEFRHTVLRVLAR